MNTTHPSVEDVFFKAATTAALDSFSKHGKISVCMSALVQVGDEVELFPVIIDTNNVDIRMVDETVERAIGPLVDYLIAQKGARVTLLFMSAIGDGTTKDQETGRIEMARMIINGARTEHKVGKTEVYKIISRDNFELLDIGYEDGTEEWLKEPAAFDMPGIAIQSVLAQAWLSLVTLKSMKQIGI